MTIHHEPTACTTHTALCATRRDQSPPAARNAVSECARTRRRFDDAGDRTQPVYRGAAGYDSADFDSGYGGVLKPRDDSPSGGRHSYPCPHLHSPVHVYAATD